MSDIGHLSVCFPGAGPPPPPPPPPLSLCLSVSLSLSLPLSLSLSLFAFHKKLCYSFSTFLPFHHLPCNWANFQLSIFQPLCTKTYVTILCSLVLTLMCLPLCSFEERNLPSWSWNACACHSLRSPGLWVVFQLGCRSGSVCFLMDVFSIKFLICMINTDKWISVISHVQLLECRTSFMAKKINVGQLWY